MSTEQNNARSDTLIAKVMKTFGFRHQYQVAEYFGVTAQTLSGWVKTGIVPDKYVMKFQLDVQELDQSKIHEKTLNSLDINDSSINQSYKEQNIAEFSKLIDANDLKKSSFIKDYFTDKEISYSESRPNSIETICGIFSAKESIRKTGNKDNFKNIEITHVEGRPVCGNYYISISHSAEVCVAVCIQT